MLNFDNYVNSVEYPTVEKFPKRSEFNAQLFRFLSEDNRIQKQFKSDLFAEFGVLFLYPEEVCNVMWAYSITPNFRDFPTIFANFANQVALYGNAYDNLLKSLSGESEETNAS